MLLYVVYLLVLINIQSIVAQKTSYASQSNLNVRHYEFNITQKSINPDCSDHVSPVFLINGQMPGPTINAVQGDVVRVLIRNQLAPMPRQDDHRHNVAIHFHGIRQYGSVHSDGVPYLTQMPIKPGEEYVHEFRIVNQAGTYFYHAHVGLQEETVFGPIVVYESKHADPENNRAASSLLKAGTYTYHDERTILLSEWWHRPHMEFEKFLMGPKFNFIPEADSILINGHTLHDFRKATVAQCGGYELVPVQPNKIYRLRVIGATAFRTLGFAIARHNLTIIEVDGELTKPYTVNQLEVAPGQRFSVLLYTDQALDDYSIQVVRRWSDNVARPTNGLAILQYPQPSARTNETESRGIVRIKKPVVLEPPLIKAQFEKPEDEVPYWRWSDIEPLYGVDPVVYRPATRTIKLRSVDQRMPDNTTRWLVNGVAFSEEHSKDSPILHDIKSNRRQLPGFYDTITKDGYDRNLGTYPISHFDIVDIVIQTTHKPGEPCRSHPWHTHGHSHWEIAHGKGEYVHERDADIQNVKTPLQKDITMIYPSIDTDLFGDDTPVGCGWSKIRLVADNPGVWAVHCHNTVHMLMGMMVALEEAPELIPRYSN
ncbi:Cupredoxin [Parasitella parasitica]|nr:Cupredoxin [Parasitella parasitica]